MAALCEAAPQYSAAQLLAVRAAGELGGGVPAELAHLQVALVIAPVAAPRPQRGAAKQKPEARRPAGRAPADVAWREPPAAERPDGKPLADEDWRQPPAGQPAEERPGSVAGPQQWPGAAWAEEPERGLQPPAPQPYQATGPGPPPLEPADSCGEDWELPDHWRPPPADTAGWRPQLPPRQALEAAAAREAPGLGPRPAAEAWAAPALQHLPQRPCAAWEAAADEVAPAAAATAPTAAPAATPEAERLVTGSADWPAGGAAAAPDARPEAGALPGRWRRMRQAEPPAQPAELLAESAREEVAPDARALAESAGADDHPTGADGQAWRKLPAHDDESDDDWTAAVQGASRWEAGWAGGDTAPSRPVVPAAPVDPCSVDEVLADIQNTYSFDLVEADRATEAELVEADRLERLEVERAAERAEAERAEAERAEAARAEAARAAEAEREAARAAEAEREAARLAAAEAERAAAAAAAELLEEESGAAAAKRKKTRGKKKKGKGQEPGEDDEPEAVVKAGVVFRTSLSNHAQRTAFSAMQDSDSEGREAEPPARPQAPALPREREPRPPPPPVAVAKAPPKAVAAKPPPPAVTAKPPPPAVTAKPPPPAVATKPPPPAVATKPPPPAVAAKPPPPAVAAKPPPPAVTAKPPPPAVAEARPAAPPVPEVAPPAAEPLPKAREAKPKQAAVKAKRLAAPAAQAQVPPSVWAARPPSEPEVWVQPPPQPTAPAGWAQPPASVVPQRQAPGPPPPPPPAVGAAGPPPSAAAQAPKGAAAPKPGAKAKAPAKAPAVKAMNPLPQAGRSSKDATATVMLNGGLPAAYSSANAASSAKWAERPVEKITPQRYEEEEDPDMARYLWKNRQPASAATLASGRAVPAAARQATAARAPAAGPALPPPSRQRQQALLNKVMEMGFDEPTAKRALNSTGWAGVENALGIPARLAYGENPGNGRPGGMLVFDVELFDILRGPQPPAVPVDVAGPPVDAERTASGLAWKVLKAPSPGFESRRPSVNSRVTLDYAGWKPDGELIISTAVTGQPATFTVKGISWVFCLDWPLQVLRKGLLVDAESAQLRASAASHAVLPVTPARCRSGAVVLPPVLAPTVGADVAAIEVSLKRPHAIVEETEADARALEHMAASGTLSSGSRARGKDNKKVDAAERRELEAPLAAARAAAVELMVAAGTAGTGDAVAVGAQAVGERDGGEPWHQVEGGAMPAPPS
ncbi:unnamed protein product [Prorocentrum cordatum]|uniref:Uncharacterized protein n=1 Tax=Prorocentrum cordatum TaxID=2364126 RepID=A0ABN9QKY3_9DINO|nr:unnamed protein product [Polarella glacialis]